MKKLKKGQIVSEDQKKQLLTDYNSGKFSSVDLVGKYKVSQSRIYQILAECQALGLQVNYK